MRSHWILVLLTAFGLALFTPVSRADEDESKEESGTKVKLEDCPAAVQATLKKEANGAALDDIEKQTADGKTVYEADIKVDGKEVELRVGDDGKLISRQVEEEDEKKEDDEKDKK